MPQIPIDESSRAADTADGSLHEILPDVAYQRLAIVNVAYIGRPGEDWMLVDAGVAGMTRAIERAAERRFGKDSKPTAIVMTHGHFDHVGALETLAERWEVPVYAHVRELPYLEGAASYPPPDPSVRGLMARLSRFYPRGPVDVSRYVRPLPDDGSVPGMSGWRWIHTPGHTTGHVAFWRESDRTLLSGDAVITTRQESAYSVATQKPELHGPPQYFTPDWKAAGESVRRLAALDPELVVRGHGRALRGEKMRTALKRLAEEFDRVAVPG